MTRWEDLDDLDRIEAASGLWQPRFVEVVVGYRRYTRALRTVVPPATWITADSPPRLSDTVEVVLATPIVEPIMETHIDWTREDGGS